MRNHAFSLLAALALTTTATGSLHAQTIVTQPGTVYQTQSMKSSSTAATDMQGMRVAAHFADGQVVSGLAWNEIDAETGDWGVSSSRFRLWMGGSDNTGSEGAYVWRLQNLGGVGLTRLVFSGAPGRTVFDMDYFQETTPNSAHGLPLAFAPVWIDDVTTQPSPYAATSTATYRNAVALVGSAPLGDIFEEVDLLFGAPLAAGDSIAFDLDADTIGDGASIDPVGGPVTATPEPASVALVGGGLLALGGAGYRRRRATA